MRTIPDEVLTNLPIVDLGDIYLRAIVFEDYEDMFEYGSDVRVTKNLSWHYETLEDAKQTVPKVFLSRPKRNLPNAYALVTKDTNKMIGTCDFHTIDWEQNTGEIGYALHYDYWGKGYMTLACKALIAFGFNNLKLDTIVISHNILNIGSQKVIEKAGFNFVIEKPHPKLQTINRFYELTKEEYLNKKL